MLWLYFSYKIAKTTLPETRFLLVTQNIFIAYEVFMVLSLHLLTIFIDFLRPILSISALLWAG